jgi:hypothetical protein
MGSLSIPFRYWDAFTNEELPASRAEKLASMNEREAWDVSANLGQLDSNWQSSPARCVEVNTGDFKRPVVRSRCVANELRNKRRDELLAAAHILRPCV